MVVATAKNIESLMGKEKMNYFEPGYPYLFWPNKKSALQEFLFGKNENYKLKTHTSNPRIKILEDKIQNLSNQVDFLQQKIIQLEHNQNILRETNLNDFSETPKSRKINSLTLEQDRFTLKGKKGGLIWEKIIQETT